jgi:hypothetical protein
MTSPIAHIFGIAISVTCIYCNACSGAGAAFVLNFLNVVLSLQNFLDGHANAFAIITV